jgi:RNA polymerase sigma-70 factor, ECF subfamily
MECTVHTLLATIDPMLIIETLPEQVLVELGKAGDHAAFTELIRRSSSPARRAVRSMTRNADDVEDVMQETFLRAYKGLPGFTEQCKFATWLTRIAINNALMHLRRRERRAEVSLDSEQDERDNRVIEVPDDGVDPEQSIILSQAAAILRQAVNALPVELQVYIQRHCFEDLPHREAASSLGITVAAGKSRSQRAQHRLESTLTRMFARPA